MAAFSAVKYRRAHMKRDQLVDDVLGFLDGPGADPAKVLRLLQKHTRLTKKDWFFMQCASKAHFLLGDANKALEAADAARALDVEGDSAWGEFWRAAALAVLGETDAMLASLRVACSREKTKAPLLALSLEAFKPYRDSAAFLAAIDRPPEPKLDKTLVGLLERCISGDLFDFYRATRKALKHADADSVLDARIVALEAILEDFDEHGDSSLRSELEGVSVEALVEERDAALKQRAQSTVKRSAFSDALSRRR
jgi:hypothetical protein